MRVWIAFAVVAVAVSAAVVIQDHHGDVRAQFEQFKLNYNRRYATIDEDARRFEAFKSNMRHAAELQHRNPLATFGVNQFADITEEEKRARLGGKVNKAPAHRLAPTSEALNAATSTSFVDWRREGIVTDVKDQGDCSCCWAFAAMANLESQWAKAGNELVSLSTQEIVSCAGVSGCAANYIQTAWSYLLNSQMGLASSWGTYPYTASTGSVSNCSLPKRASARITNYVDLQSGERNLMAFVYSIGPIAMCIDASTWYAYTGGIMTDCPAGGTTHCITVVGYNATGSTPYWIIKNSWGTTWGIDGYIHVAKGQGLCDIGQYSTTSFALANLTF
jgi:C1A family cysteine protease